MHNPTSARERREIGIAIDQQLRRFFGTEYDSEEMHTEIAARLRVSTSALYGYLNGSQTFPPQVLARLAGLVRDEVGLGEAQALLYEVLNSANGAPGARLEVWLPPFPAKLADKEAEARADFTTFARSVADSIAKAAEVLADGRVTGMEYRQAHPVLIEAAGALIAMDEALRAASAPGEEMTPCRA